jgi:acetyl-CoA C-acetyltransferase
MNVWISGWSHSEFGKHDSSLEQLIVPVVNDAIENAGITARDIDEIYLGNFNAGMNDLAFPSSLVLQADKDLFGLPATRIENACASGAGAVHAGSKALMAGTARTVLVVGAEKMTEKDRNVVGAALLGADYDAAGRASRTGFAGLFADVSAAYQERHEDPSTAMALIAAKSHKQGLLNPYAHVRRAYDFEFCMAVSEKNPQVSGHIRRTDCSPVSDGAAALVLTTTARMSSHAATAAVRVAGLGQSNDYLPGKCRDPLAFVGSEIAWERALKSAGVDRTAVSFAELHDCFTIAELNLYEVLGIAPRGRGRSVIEDGTVLPTGSFPVNPSGGLKSKGHPIGATGVSQVVTSAMQLTGTAGDLQLPRADVAAVHNMGGLAVANYVTVLSQS